MDPATLNTLTLVFTTVLSIAVGLIAKWLHEKDSAAKSRIGGIETLHREDIKAITERHREDTKRMQSLHEEDAARLVALELKMTDGYYGKYAVDMLLAKQKEDMDALFGLMRSSLSDGFSRLEHALAEVKSDVRDIRNHKDS